MKKILKQSLLMLILVFVLILPFLVFAQSGITDNLVDVADKSGYKNEGGAGDEMYLPIIAGMIVKAFLSILGIIFVILILYAGYNWMTAAGEEQKVTTAKSTLQRAVIGLIIIMSSFAIWEFIIKNFKV